MSADMRVNFVVCDFISLPVDSLSNAGGKTFGTVLLLTATNGRIIPMFTRRWSYRLLHACFPFSLLLLLLLSSLP